MNFNFAKRNRQLLDRLAQTQNWANGYLFYGNKGAFLSQAALYLSLLIRCETEKKPCLTCPNCLQILAHNSIHFRWIKPEEKWGIEMIRSLQDEIQYGASDEHMVVVLPDCDRLSDEATNAFLKTLEEPPRGVHFILLTSKPHAVLPTIKSRCQLLDFSQGDCEAELNAKEAAEKEALITATQHHPELLKFVLESTFPDGLTYIPLNTLLQATLTQKLTYAHTFSGFKDTLPALISAWLRDSQSLPESMAYQAQQVLVATILDMKYNINIRLRLEKLFIELPDLEDFKKK